VGEVTGVKQELARGGRRKGRLRARLGRGAIDEDHLATRAHHIELVGNAVERKASGRIENHWVKPSLFSRANGMSIKSNLPLPIDLAAFAGVNAVNRVCADIA